MHRGKTSVDDSSQTAQLRRLCHGEREIRFVVEKARDLKREVNPVDEAVLT
jgi:hypothetical protein